MATSIEGPDVPARYSKNYTQSPPNRRIASSRPRPGRRRLLPTLFPFLLSITFFATLLTPTTAFDRPRFQVRRPALEGWENNIVFDPRPTPGPELIKRQFDLGSSSASKASKSSSKEEKPTSTSDEIPSPTSAEEATGSGGIISAPTGSASDLPKAFDAGLGTNYTQPGCLSFLRGMLGNDTFTKCLPVSLLLQNSQSLFSKSRSASSLDPILTASCNVDQRQCSSIMSSYALTLRSSNSCSQDYDRQQPTVRQAYNGLVSYDLLYHTICAKSVPSAANNNSADFCYSNAVTNLTNPSDAYIYYLPLGISLPASAIPTCSQCLKEAMGVFGAVSRNKSQPISLTYAAAAQQINLNCGPDFVNQSVTGASGKGAGAVVVPRLGAIVISIAIIAASQLLGLL